MRIARLLQPVLARHLDRGKSVLLLGPRQTGKTTLLGDLAADLAVSLASPAVRQRYERDPSVLAAEVEALPAPANRRAPPLVTVDEVQKVPALMDVGQDLIDRRRARFVFTGSSAAVATSVSGRPSTSAIAFASGSIRSAAGRSSVAVVMASPSRSTDDEAEDAVVRRLLDQLVAGRASPGCEVLDRSGVCREHLDEVTGRDRPDR